MSTLPGMMILVSSQFLRTVVCCSALRSERRDLILCALMCACFAPRGCTWVHAAQTTRSCRKIEGALRTPIGVRMNSLVMGAEGRGVGSTLAASIGHSGYRLRKRGRYSSIFQVRLRICQHIGTARNDRTTRKLVCMLLNANANNLGDLLIKRPEREGERVWFRGFPYATVRRPRG